MTPEDLATGNDLIDEINEITRIQGIIATAGAAGHVSVVNAGKVVLSGDELKSAIGDSAYNTICATALASLSTQLTNAKTTKQTAFDDLGTGG